MMNSYYFEGKILMAFTDAQWLFINNFAINFTLIIHTAHNNQNSFDTYNSWRGYSQALYGYCYPG